MAYDTSKRPGPRQWVERFCDSIRGTLRNMAPGEVVLFPVSKLSVVRTTASTLGLEMGRRYITQIDRSSGMIAVTYADNTPPGVGATNEA